MKAELARDLPDIEMQFSQRKGGQSRQAPHLKVEGGLVCAVDKVPAHEERVAWLTHVGKVGIGDGQLCGRGDCSLISCHHQLLPLLHFQHPLVMRPALRTSIEFTLCLFDTGRSLLLT